MGDSLPPVGEFAQRFSDFITAMHAAAERPESEPLAQLRDHLGVPPEGLPIDSTTFGIADRPNLQLALDALLVERETIGLFSPHRHRMGGTGFADLMARFGGPAQGTQPVEYIDVELGDGRVVRCIASALILATWEGVPVALILSSEQGPPRGQFVLRVEGMAPDREITGRLFRALRGAMLEHNVFRGQLISLSPSGVTFPTLPVVTRDAIVLPAGTLERLERHAIGITEHAGELQQAGRHLKRGVLMHGPPGTGKTLTVNYLLTAMAGRTTVILTGQALGMIEEAFAIARDLTPATVVLEDVDLVAGERTAPGGHTALFELLNQLEGLAEDADLLILLTTNRPDMIEPALAARPGRVDLALELPLPDEDGRRRLLQLYCEEIVLDDDSVHRLVALSVGATGALIKELMRQATLRAALNRSSPTAVDVLSILDELLEERGALTRRLLGQPPDGSQAEPPSPSMLRAITASGLPVPPEVPRRGPGGLTGSMS